MSPVWSKVPCSGDVLPGTGILANNVLGEEDLHPDGFHAARPHDLDTDREADPAHLGDDR